MDGRWRDEGGEVGGGESGKERRGEERGDTMWGKTKQEMR